MSIKIELLANNAKRKVIVSEGEGSWLEYIEFDGKVYWTITDPVGEWKFVNDHTLPPESQEYLLPSDSTLRLDHQLLVRKDYDEAEKAKLELEEL